MVRDRVCMTRPGGGDVGRGRVFVAGARCVLQGAMVDVLAEGAGRLSRDRVCLAGGGGKTP